MTQKAPKLSAQIVEEASDWFVEFSEGDVDAAAREQFDTWLRRSPEHVQAYLRITALWEDASMLEKGRVLPSQDLVARVLAEGNIVPLQVPEPKATEPPPADPPPDVSPQQVRLPPLVLRQPVSSNARQRLVKMRLMAIAASLLVAVATGTWFYVGRGTYSTGTGEQRSVRLDDGSTVDLNSQSKVRVRFSEHRRDVELLEGQALFRVAKDKERPFIVATDNTHVRAVGTQFDVYRKTSGTVVTVLEGRVAVLPEIKSLIAPEPPDAQAQREGGAEAPPSGPSGKAEAPQSGGVVKPPRVAAHTNLDVAFTPAVLPTALAPRDGEIVLAAGEQLTVTAQAVSQPEPANLAVATAWTQRKIAFQGAPLSEVVEEFNRYNTRPLVVADPDLKSTKISGVFSSTDPDSLLRFLRSLPNISIQETSHEIRISRK
jgi:transmembrane sensor